MRTREKKRTKAALLRAFLLRAALMVGALGMAGASGGCGRAGEDTAALPSGFYQEEDGVAYGFRCGERYLEVYDGEAFAPLYLNGVNIGSGIPGHFPGELAIDKETYLRWFDEISAMNANTIRVYTTMMPCFYEALYEHNTDAEEPLYLIAGVWYDEDVLANGGTAYDVLEGAVAEACEQVDIIHGQAQIAQRQGKAYGEYRADVSEWTMAWILGIEPDAELVGGTNAAYPERDRYEGEYLYTEESDAFHAFLAELGDRTIAYETEHYGMQRPISWTNWPTADALSHPAEPLAEREDAVTVNVERIHCRESFAPGIFASYHIYPYYPDFMYLQEDYASYLDEHGNPNTYEAYVRELAALHSVPLLVAEFGVPSSRGVTHINPVTGLDQGHLNESQQGWCLDAMARDIYRSGCAGGLVFSWQDEWFKRTWNTMDYSNADRRALWNDVQTSEQHFGLLSFDAGERDIVVIDGDISEWTAEDVLVADGELALSVKHDEAYLYLLVTGVSPEEAIILPVDVTPASGAFSYGETVFDSGADFVIELNGREESRVLVQGYYDRYAWFYQAYDNQLDTAGYGDADGTDFHPIYLSLNRVRTDPRTGEVLDAERAETGRLTYGISNPADEAYNSLADFYYGEDAVELRLPWGLLNFRDPSGKEIEGDHRADAAAGGVTIPAIRLGVCRAGGTAVLAPYVYAGWDTPSYHERLKLSYDILRECFAGLVL